MQDDVATRAPRRGLLSAWLGGGTDDRAPQAAPRDDRAAHASVQRKLFDDLGDFLFAHDLAVTPTNLEIAQAYLSGQDRGIGAAITAELRDTGRVGQALLDGLWEKRHAAGIGPDMLARLADALETRVAECLSAIGQSCSSAESYGSALDAEAANLATDPDGVIGRVIALTREVVDATRLAEDRLKQTAIETDRLRTDLEHAQRAAEHDHLTDLPNRRCFEQRLKGALATKTTDGTLCVALCDIDDFKQVNDRYGHQMGDRVLKYVARFLKTELGGKVLVARYGGEEFACLFAHHDAARAADMLDAVRDRLTRRSLINQDTGQSIGSVTFSAGIAMVGDDPSAALRTADLALYAAKRIGKNRVAIAPGSMNPGSMNPGSGAPASGEDG